MAASVAAVASWLANIRVTDKEINVTTRRLRALSKVRLNVERRTVVRTWNNILD